MFELRVTPRLLLLSFDFEDWHQLVHRRPRPTTTGTRRGHALERQTEAIFALLDELGARATFFVLGMTAERYPDLVREIAAPRATSSPATATRTSGCTTQTPDEFRRDVERCADAPRAARRPAAARLPGAGLLDHPRHAVGLRGARRARLPLRLQPVRLAADPTADPTRAADARTGSSCRPAARSGSFRSRSGASAAARCRSAAARTGASCRHRSSARAAAGRRRERLPCAVLPSVRARPAPAAGRAAREPDPAAATARRLEERPAKPRQAARRGSDSCNRPRIPRSSATRRHMEKSSNATELVRDHFREKASSFDALYDEEHPLQRAVRARAC